MPAQPAAISRSVSARKEEIFPSSICASQTVRGVACGDEVLRKIVDGQDSLALSSPILDELLSVPAR